MNTSSIYADFSFPGKSLKKQDGQELKVFFLSLGHFFSSKAVSYSENSFFPRSPYTSVRTLFFIALGGLPESAVRISLSVTFLFFSIVWAHIDVNFLPCKKR